MRYCLFVFTIVLLVANSVVATAQDDSLKPQVLAPGVLKTIKPVIDPRDTHSMPMVTPGINAIEFDPLESPKTNTLWQQSRKIIMFRDCWQYEFAFLGLRQITIEVPVSPGVTVKRNYWYLVYRIRNTGEVVTNESIFDPKFNQNINEKRYNFQDLNDERRQELITKLQEETLYGRFLGNFRLEGWVENIVTGEYVRVEYEQTFDPMVVDKIRAEEDPATELLSSAQLLKKSLPIVSPNSKYGGLWGVAIWEDVDPRLDYVSVYVNGLTNAFRIEHQQDGSQKTVQKTLQLNFWRPGDSIDQSDDVVDYGIPLTNDHRKQIEVCYRYELPGPVIQGFELNNETTRQTLLFEIDGGVGLRDLESGLARELSEGRVPKSVEEAFANAGMALPAGVKPEETVAGTQWKFEADFDGEKKSIILQLTPRFWGKDVDGGLRFTDSLDHLWIYE